MPYHNERIRLLFLWGNTAEQPLDLEGEFKDIARELKLGYFDDAFEMKVVPQTSVEDFLSSCNSFRPHVIHFGGHGERDGSLMFVNSQAKRSVSQDIPAELLEGIFKAIAGEVSLVVLNACYSETLARRLRYSVDCVIGTTAAIGDEAAGRSVGQAFDQGKVVVQIRQHSPTASRHPEPGKKAKPVQSEAALYALRARDGIDPYLRFLVQDDTGKNETPWDELKDLELYRQRVEGYKKLWAHTEVLAKYAREKAFAPKEAKKLSSDLRQWYFQEGGLFLSEHARRAYFAFQELLQTVVKQSRSSTTPLDEHTFEEVRNKSSILRTALASDLGARA